MFKMRVTDIFTLEDKSIFCGDIDFDDDKPLSCSVSLLLDGKVMNTFNVQGPIHHSSNNYDVWTKELIDKELLTLGEVLLVEENEAEPN